VWFICVSNEGVTSSLSVQVTTLAEDLVRKAAIARPESIRVGKQMNFYIRQMSMVTRQIMATVSELSLVQVRKVPSKN